MTSRKGLARIGDLSLQHGGMIRDCHVAYEMLGMAGAPVLLVLGGISAGRHVVSLDHSGWWDDVLHAGWTNQDHFQIIGFDFLGGFGDSSRLERDRDVLDPGDQAAAIARALRSIGVERVAVAIGSSYGGMVLMHLAARTPAICEQLVIISAAHRPHPMSTALRGVQRDVVRLGHDTNRTTAALAIARSIAMTTYRTEQEFEDRFDYRDRPLQFPVVSPVERYLRHVGQRFAETRTAEGFLCLSQSIDLHDVAPESIRVPTTLIAVREDRNVPLTIMAECAKRLPALKAFHTVTSRFGHDAFLKEPQMIAGLLAPICGGVHAVT